MPKDADKDFQKHHWGETPNLIIHFENFTKPLALLARFQLLVKIFMNQLHERHYLSIKALSYKLKILN